MHCAKCAGLRRPTLLFWAAMTWVSRTVWHMTIFCVPVHGQTLMASTASAASTASTAATRAKDLLNSWLGAPPLSGRHCVTCDRTCSTHGRCLFSGDFNATCLCSQGYYGADCEFSCPNLCSGLATCHNGLLSFFFFVSCCVFFLLSFFCCFFFESGYI